MSKQITNDGKSLGGDLMIPVLQEHLNVEIDTVATGLVEIRKDVHRIETPIIEELLAETITTERVPMNIRLEAPASTRHEGDTTIIPVMEEVVVITKQLMLKEEIRITRHRSVSHYRDTVVLQSEQIHIERKLPRSS